MNFQKYQHVERIGTTETDGIEFGTCYVFPKIDGSNGSIWLDDNSKLACGSRNRELTLDNDNQGFMDWALKQKNIEIFLKENTHLKLFGEWLVPHTLKTYQKGAWNKFYVFDVVTDNGIYLPYDEYKTILDKYSIDYIPPICKLENPTTDKLIEILEKNIYLIDDGNGVGEGVVIKNYGYRNRFGRQTWAKIVRNEFKEKHWKNKTPEVKTQKETEALIVEKYVTSVLIEKEFAKIKNDNNYWSSSMIPRLLNTVYYNLVKEESWNFVKENKNPKIDFKRLMNLSFQKTKELKPELF
jgi:hypothetical protein